MAPIQKSDYNQSAELYLLYGSVVTITGKESSDKSKHDSINTFINNFYQYWEAEKFYENNTLIDKKNIPRNQMDNATFEKIKKLKDKKKLIGGKCKSKSIYYEKYLKYKSKYFNLDGR